jgi:REP-associated tyrosine transposase
MSAHAGAPLPDSRPAAPGTGRAPTPACGSASLQKVIQWFKTMTTNEYIRGVKAGSWPSFNGRLWQRNYYEHIIRDEDSLNRIRQYIVNNPTRWAFDRENPAAAAPEPENPWLA